jgi:hypothetical protein
MKARRRYAGPPPPCQCIGCGCDDNHACPDLLGDPCSWLVQSETGRLGVCSRCPTHLPRWRTKEGRKFSDRATAAIAQRRLLEFLSRPNRLAGSRKLT